MVNEPKACTHPTLNDIVVFDDGSVMIPANGTHKAHLTKGCKDSGGYMRVRVAGKKYSVHRLVVETFIGEIPADKEVDHVNRCRDDNRLVNLRIVSHSENQRNRASVDRVTAEGRVHKYEDQVRYDREAKRKYRAEHREEWREYNRDYMRAWREKHREEWRAKHRESTRKWRAKKKAEREAQTKQKQPALF